MLLGRLFSYRDTHLYRIGTNYQQLPVNRPHAEVHSYNKDGAMRYKHSGNQPVYAPNSYGGPRADPRFMDTVWGVEGAEMVRHAYTQRRDDDDFGRPGVEIDRAIAGDHGLCGRDVLVPGPDDLVDARNRRRSVREGGDGVGAADAK